MDVLVITVYNSFNFGAFLQAYAMETYLESRGHKVDFLCMDPHDIHFHKKYYKTKNPLRFLKRMQTEKCFNKDLKNIHSVNSLTKEYDLAIIGSDELWNVKNDGFIHVNEYLGFDLPAKKIITYAVSCNKSTVNDFTKMYPFPNLFSKLDRIAVRDSMTEKLVNDINSSFVVEKVLDPTFLVDFKKKRKKINETYILVYGYRFLETEKNAIIKYAKEKNLPLYSIGFEHDWCDKYLNCGPLRFLDYMYSAQTVITATFHGSVFSIIFNKNFASFGRDNSKILDLLSIFGLDDRNASNENVLKILSHDIDFQHLNTKVDEMKNQSLKYLMSVGC